MTATSSADLFQQIEVEQPIKLSGDFPRSLEKFAKIL